MSHFFSGSHTCPDCGKTISELFYELLEQDNEEALRYNYSVMMGGCFSESEQYRIVVANHVDCLTPDERLIKDVIE